MVGFLFFFNFPIWQWFTKWQSYVPHGQPMTGSCDYTRVNNLLNLSNWNESLEVEMCSHPTPLNTTSRRATYRHQRLQGICRKCISCRRREEKQPKWRRLRHWVQLTFEHFHHKRLVCKDQTRYLTPVTRQSSQFWWGYSTTALRSICFHSFGALAKDVWSIR